MALQKRTGGIFVGLYNNNYVLSTYALNAASTWLAYGLTIDGSANKTLNKVRAVLSAITVTQANISISASLYSSTSDGKPSTLLDGPYTITDVGAGVQEWTGFNYVIVPGTPYWIVFKNTAVDPTVDYPTFRYSNNYAVDKVFGHSAPLSFTKYSSTDGGSTWSSVTTNGAFVRYEFSDGALIGNPFTNYAYGTKVYGANYSGVKFRTPSNAVLNVTGIVFHLYPVNSPTGNIVAKLKYGSTEAETIAVPVGLRQVGPMGFFFESPQSIPPDTDVIIWFTVGSGGIPHYIAVCEYVLMDDSGSKGMMPFADGTNTFWQKISSTDSGANIAYDTAAAPLIGLILSSDGEFSSSGSGSGLIVHPGMCGGMRG
jgi:hypothetical protein